MEATEAKAAAVQALDRVVYLMDRGFVAAQKAKAFANAAKVVGALNADDLLDRARTGTLVDLDGIGPSTGGVIADAALGRPSPYLQDLEVSTRLDPGDGLAVRQALRGDCHSHTTWSDGGAELATMARTAMDLGHEYLVVTDHSARLTIAHGLNEERLLNQLAEIALLNMELAPFRVLTGMEVDILEDGALDLSDDLLSQLDVVVASVHSKLSMAPQEMTRRMVMAVASPNVDILGHCTGRKVTGKGRPQSRFDAELVFAACSRFDTAVEINCRPERQDPPEELLQLALDWGCKVSIDTDAHAPGQLEWQAHGAEKAVRCGVPPESIVNTWEADELISWAASHPTQ